VIDIQEALSHVKTIIEDNDKNTSLPIPSGSINSKSQFLHLPKVTIGGSGSTDVTPRA
jgi:hypothetical protein